MRFGPYELVDRLGSGGMADVFLARAVVEDFERSLAIKRIHGPLSHDPTWVEMFVDEARIMADLHHPNIVQVLDFGEVNGVYYLAMELVDGHDLGWVIDHFGAHGPIPVAVGIYIALEIAQGLGHAHGKRGSDGRLLNLVHRDISPANVLVSWEGEVKLTDFGIAKTRRRAIETTQGKVKGKFGYMSPEQVRGEPLDQRADLFALGILMYELFAGKPLFRSESPAATIRKVMHGPIHPPSRVNPMVPSELDAIVLKLLARDLPLRYPSADVLVTDLMNCARATSGTILTSDLAAWMQGRRQNVASQSRSAGSQKKPDTQVERVVAGRMHGLLSGPSVLAPEPEPSLSTEVRLGGEGTRARPTRDDIPLRRRSNPDADNKDLDGIREVASSTLRVPKMASRPLRPDPAGTDVVEDPIEDLDERHDHATQVSLGNDVVQSVVDRSSPIASLPSRSFEGRSLPSLEPAFSNEGEDFDFDEATRVRFEGDLDFEADTSRLSPDLDAGAPKKPETPEDLNRTAVALPALDVEVDDIVTDVRPPTGPRQVPVEDLEDDDDAGFGDFDDRTEVDEGALHAALLAAKAQAKDSEPPAPSSSEASPWEEHPAFDEDEEEATSVSLGGLDEGVDDAQATNVRDPLRPSPDALSSTVRLPDMEVLVASDDLRAHLGARERSDTLPTGMPVTGPLPKIDPDEAEIYAFSSDDEPTEALPSRQDDGASGELRAEAYPSAEVLVSDRMLHEPGDEAQEVLPVTGPTPMAAPTGTPSADLPSADPPSADRGSHSIPVVREVFSSRSGRSSRDETGREEALSSGLSDAGLSDAGLSDAGLSDTAMGVESVGLTAAISPDMREKSSSKMWRWVGIFLILLMLAVAGLGAYYLQMRRQARKASVSPPPAAAATLGQSPKASPSP